MVSTTYCPCISTSIGDFITLPLYSGNRNRRTTYLSKERREDIQVPCPEYPIAVVDLYSDLSWRHLLVSVVRFLMSSNGDK